MKTIGREFTRREKLLLLILSLVLVGLAYYQFVDRPVRESLTNAHAERDSLSAELTTVQAKLKVMRRMREEMEDITAGGTASEMKSYNNSKAEIKLLNDILDGTPDYSITFANVQRDGDQIRRNFSLRFTAEDYETLERIIEDLTKSPYRCLVGDLKITGARGSAGIRDGNVTANATATFFETMVGGTPDAGLPETKAAAK